MSAWRLTCLAAAIAAGGVALVLLVSPGSYAGIYLPAADAGAEFIGRRAAAPTAGLAALVLVMAGLPRGALRARLALIVACVWVGFALTGSYEWITGAANWRVLAAAVVELGFAAAFLRFRAAD